MSRVALSALSVAAAFAVLLAAQSAPAEAGKIGRAVARTATKATVVTAIKGKKGDKEDEGEAQTRSSIERQSVTGDVEGRAAHARAKLEEEKGQHGTVFAGATDMSAAPNAGIVCLAGCN